MLPASSWRRWRLKVAARLAMLQFRASAHERLEPQRFFTAEMKRSVINGSERTDGCFTTADFQTQYASFCVRGGGRTAVAGGNGTQENIPACANERKNNRTASNLRLLFQGSACIMDLDSKTFDSERLKVEVEKRQALYNKATPEYSDKNYKEKIWIDIYEAVVSNWGRLDTKERVATGHEIQRKWRNIRDNFRKELQLQKNVTSGQGARKRRKYIYFDQLLFLLPIMQQLDTSGNITPPPRVEVSGAQDLTPENQPEEPSHSA